MHDDTPPTPRPVPERWTPLFWDCDLRDLDLDRHRDQIIERVLQDGDVESVRWLLETFGDETFRNFVIDHGERRLDPKILGFWWSDYGLGEPACATRSSLIHSARGSRY